MKKLIATLALVGGLAAYANAQGTFTIDSFANEGDGATPTSSTGGLVFLNGVLDTATDINLEVLWGLTSGSVTTPVDLDPLSLNGGAYTGDQNWYASQSTGSGDIVDYANGCILDPNGNTYTISSEGSGTTIWLVIEGWTGTSATYGGAGTVDYGVTAPFSITLAANSSPTQPDVHTMPSLNLVPVPEPTSIALCVMGGVGLLAMRRRKA